MSTPPTEPTTTADNPRQPQRDANGRFLKGNSGGTGNPFARQCAALRKAAAAVVSPQDAADVMAVMLAQAKQGDVAAAKFLFSYAVGRPTDAPDPDRLDLDEWQLVQERAIPIEDLAKPLRGFDVNFARQVMPIVVEAQTKTLGGQLRNGLAALDEADRRRAEAQATEVPSTNRANGAAPTEDRPSVNRPDGARKQKRKKLKSEKARVAVAAASGGRPPSASDGNELEDLVASVAPEAIPDIMAKIAKAFFPNRHNPPPSVNTAIGFSRATERTDGVGGRQQTTGRW